MKPYPEYKNSGVEWLGEVPAEWRIAPIKAMFEITGGTTPKSDNPDFWDGDILWVTPADLSDLPDRYVSATSRMITIEGLNSCGTRLTPAGSLVLSTRAPIGSLAVSKCETCTNQGCKTLTPREGVTVDYFYYVVLTAKEQLNNLGRGSTFLELSGDLLGAFRVPSPPLPEQRKIAAFLDREVVKIDDLIEEQRRLIALLAEKRQATISHAVTKGLNPNAKLKPSGIDWPRNIPEDWKVLSLTRVVKKFVDYRGVTPTKVDSGVPLITATQIKNGKIEHELDPVYITEEEYETRMTRGWPEVGDVLLTTEAPLGETAQIVDPYVSPGQRIILMKVEPDLIRNDYLFTHFRSQFGQNQLWERASGSTASGIRADRLRGSLVLVPPLDEQEKIVAHVSQVTSAFEEIQSNANSQITLLQERRAALISAAVTGKIDLRDFDDSTLG